MAERESAVRAAEPGGQRLPRRFGDHTRPRETQQRSRLGHAYVAEGGKARQYPSSTRIGEDGDEGQAGLVDEIHRARCFGHLHETEDALLHARPTRTADRDDRQLVGDREFRAAPEPFTDHAAHAAPHEAEVHEDEDATCTLDTRGPRDDGLGEPRLRLRRAYALGVCLQVNEPKRIERRNRRPQLTEGSFVRQLADTLPSANTQMEPAERAHHEIGAQRSKTGALPAGRTLPLGLAGVAAATLNLDGDVHWRAPTARR